MKSRFFRILTCTLGLMALSMPVFAQLKLVDASAKVEEEKAIAEQNTNKLKSIKENFVFVQGGTFLMGSNSGESDEKPVHNVTVSSFYIGKTEVTQTQWKTVMGNNPSYCKGDKRPVEQVSWYDAIVFCNKLSMMDGRTPTYSVNGKTDPDAWNYTPCKGNSISGTITMNMNASGYRLPTEAEWEYAAWGGNKRKGYKYSGSDNLGSVAWYYDNSGDQTHDVATKAPNELGLYDMSGNVWEWCWDWYDSNYYSKSPSSNPSGASLGAYRVQRGGGYDISDYGCRVAIRITIDIYGNYYKPDNGDRSIGFRIVCPSSAK